MSAIVAITMPRWGLTMEEGTLTDWLVPLGNNVTAGSDIVEVESTKLAGTIEAPVDGVLRRQIIAPGQTVPVGALLGIIAGADVADTEIDVFTDSFVVTEAADADEEVFAASTIQVGDERISYLRRGAGDAVLFIHGFGGDAAGWGFVQDALSTDYDTIAIDLPGHGGSSKTVGNGSLEGQSAIVAAFIRALEVGSVHIIAHSMGGGIALALALQEPELVRSLTLLAPMGLGEAINADYLHAFTNAEKLRDVTAVLRTLFVDPSIVTRTLAEDVMRYKRVDGVREALETIGAGIAPGGKQSLLLADRLADIRQPIKLLWGEEDRIIPITQAPGAITTRLPGVGHMPQVEASERVISIARSNLAAG